jgi:hypothetical protein
MILLFTLGAMIALTLPAAIAGATVSIACAIVLRILTKRN